MKALVYDTETTGLPDYKQPSEAPHQPHIVELAALLHDDAGTLVDTFHAIIRPDGWTIPDDVAAIHGITIERAMDEGIPEAEALFLFLNLHTKCDLRVAHNESFDQRILRIAIKRFYGRTQEDRDNYAETFKSQPSCCTMKMAHARSKETGAGLKWPLTLKEAHQHFLGEAFDGAHGALADAQACARVYFALNPIPAVA